MKKTALVLVIVLCCTLAGNALGTSETSSVTNKNLQAICNNFIENLQMLIQADSDLDYPTSKFDKLYYSSESQIRTGYGDTRKVIDAGCYSRYNTFTLGAGSGLDDEGLWYVSLTFTDESTEETIIWNSFLLTLATTAVGVNFGNDDEGFANAEDLVITLLNNEGNIAFEVDGAVFFKKDIGGGKTIFGVNSLDFYNTFYGGSIAEYYQISFT